MGLVNSRCNLHVGAHKHTYTRAAVTEHNCVTTRTTTYSQVSFYWWREVNRFPLSAENTSSVSLTLSASKIIMSNHYRWVVKNSTDNSTHLGPIPTCSSCRRIDTYAFHFLQQHFGHSLRCFRKLFVSVTGADDNEGDNRCTVYCAKLFHTVMLFLE